MTASGAQVPSQAVWANRLWLVSAVLFVATGIWALVAGGLSGSDLVIGVGVIALAAGVALAVLARRAGAPDARFRSSVAVLTLVLTVLGMLLAVVTIIPFALISGIVGLVGSMLAYRPAAEEWYTRDRLGD